MKYLYQKEAAIHSKGRFNNKAKIIYRFSLYCHFLKSHELEPFYCCGNISLETRNTPTFLVEA